MLSAFFQKNRHSREGETTLERSENGTEGVSKAHNPIERKLSYLYVLCLLNYRLQYAGMTKFLSNYW